jgi:hypothetical protein
MYRQWAPISLPFPLALVRRAHLHAMPPTRSRPGPVKSEAGPSTGSHDKTLHKRKPGHGPHRKPHVPREPLASPAAPGVQKLKAALRQTRRLLAKVCYVFCLALSRA